MSYIWSQLFIRSALVSCPSTNCVQNRYAGLQLSVWSCAFAYEWVLSTGFNSSGRRQLRSGTTGILHIPRAKSSIGSRSFAVTGPVTWLPAELRTLELSVPSFAMRLKTSPQSNVLPRYYWATTFMYYTRAYCFYRPNCRLGLTTPSTK